MRSGNPSAESRTRRPESAPEDWNAWEAATMDFRNTGPGSEPTYYSDSFGHAVRDDRFAQDRRDESTDVTAPASRGGAHRLPT
ncbi:M23 family peptidase, partial [Rhodococcus opacus]|nr:M23 family peptidase [Rhodococcus opacus]